MICRSRYRIWMIWNRKEVDFCYQYFSAYSDNSNQISKWLLLHIFEKLCCHFFRFCLRVSSPIFRWGSKLIQLHNHVTNFLPITLVNLLVCYGKAFLESLLYNWPILCSQVLTAGLAVWSVIEYIETDIRSKPAALYIILSVEFCGALSQIKNKNKIVQYREELLLPLLPKHLSLVFLSAYVSSSKLLNLFASAELNRYPLRSLLWLVRNIESLWCQFLYCVRRFNLTVSLI